MALNVHVQVRDHESTETPSISLPGPRAQIDDQSTGHPGSPGRTWPEDTAAEILLVCPRPGHPTGPPPPPGPRDATHKTPAPPTLWCVDRRITRGADAYLALTGPTPGLIARGLVDRGSFLAPRWDRIGTVGQHVTVSWIQLLDPADRLPLDEVDTDLSSQLRWDEQSSAVELPATLGTQVAGVWERWFARHHRAHRLPTWMRGRGTSSRVSGAGRWWPLLGLT